MLDQYVHTFGVNFYISFNGNEIAQNGNILTENSSIIVTIVLVISSIL